MLEINSAAGEEIGQVVMAQAEEEAKNTLRSQGITEEQIAEINFDEVLQQVSQEQGVDFSNMSAVIAECETNPSLEFCEGLESLKISESEEFIGFKDKVNYYDQYTTVLLIVGIFMMLIGAGLYFLVNKPEWIYPLYRIGLSGSISSLTAFIVFYYLPIMISKVLSGGIVEQVASQQGLEPGMINSFIGPIEKLILNWMAGPISSVKLTSGIMFIIFVSVAINFFIMNKKSKGLNNNKQEVKNTK